MMGRRDRDPATIRSRRATNLGALGAFILLAGSALLAPLLPWLDGLITAILIGGVALGLAVLVAVWAFAFVAEEHEAGRPRERAGIVATWRAIGRGRGDGR